MEGQEALEGMPVRLTARNASLNDLALLLQDQHSKKLDVVAPAGAIRSEGGVLMLKGTDAEIDWDGVHTTEGAYRPTSVADEGIAEKLGIPITYLRRLRNDRPDLYDANVNGWLTEDARSFLVRCFTGNQGGEGVARALLSKSYKIVDNLDVLTAALDGVKATGTNVDVVGCDLTERRMYVKIAAPEIAALAPVLLKNYRSPWGVGQAPWETEAGRRHGWLAPDDRPTVFAGFMISNSETGGGAFQLTPRLIVKICSNGLTVTQDALRGVHLGSKMDDGVIRWSNETMQKNLELVTAQAADAVSTFLDVKYVEKVIAGIEEKSEKAINKPQDAIETIGKTLRFSQDRIDGVLDHFIKGGDVTAGGVMQAVTSFAQTLDNADDAYEMEGLALKALDLAASAA